MSKPVQNLTQNTRKASPLSAAATDIMIAQAGSQAIYRILDALDREPVLTPADQIALRYLTHETRAAAFRLDEVTRR